MRPCDLAAAYRPTITGANSGRASVSDKIPEKKWLHPVCGACSWRLWEPRRVCSADAERLRAPEDRDAVRDDYDGERDQQQRDAEHRDRAEIAAFVEIIDDHRNHLRVRSRQHDRRR